MLWLIASVVALGVGPAAFRLFRRSDTRRTRITLEVLIVVAVGGGVVFSILPESVSEVGWMAILPLICGLLGPTLIERWLRSFEGGAHVLVRIIVVSGLAVHAFSDGIALAMPSSNGEEVIALPMAVVLHRFPVGLVVWWLVRPTHGIRVALIVLAVIGMSTIVGFVTGGIVAVHVQGQVMALFQAWVAGSLLHVVVHPWEGGGHSHED
ncbi:MAG: hypothetical protein V3T05_02820 [Myxococcota bacterium]